MIVLPYLKWRGRHSPLVKIKISNNNKSITTLAYLDTGSTYSVFNSDFCERLELDLLNGEMINIIVGDGNSIPVYLFNLTVQIESLKFTAKIGFSDQLGTGINILGRETIMDEFVICFDGLKKEIIWKTE